MKHKLLLPAVALCMGSSLLVGSVRANDHQSKLSTSTSLDQNTVNASQLLHSRVLDRSGQKIGDVEDIVLDQSSGKAPFAVVKLSGDLADHGKFAPVPFTLLKFNDSDRKDTFGHRDLILQTDREKLLSASRFSTKTWPERVTWGPEVYSSYGLNWEGANVGATGSSFSSGTGSSTVTVQDTYPSRTSTYISREYSTDTDKPIDNGTGPDGRNTFGFKPQPWPYSEMQVGSSGTSYNYNTGAGRSRVIVDDSRGVDTYRSSDVVRSDTFRDNTSGTQVTVQDRYPRTTRTYEYDTVRENDKPIDNGTGPDGRDTFHFTPRPWPYHDTTDAH